MLALPFEERFAGIVAFYSIVNLSPEQAERALAQMHRALLPGGELLLAFHIGVQTVDVDDWWGTGASQGAPVSVWQAVCFIELIHIGARASEDAEL